MVGPAQSTPPATNSIDQARKLLTEPATKRYSRNYFNFLIYLCDVRLWPKADIRTESNCVLSNDRFGEKSSHWGTLASLIRGDFT